MTITTLSKFIFMLNIYFISRKHSMTIFVHFIRCIKKHKQTNIILCTVINVNYVLKRKHFYAFLCFIDHFLCNIKNHIIFMLFASSTMYVKSIEYPKSKNNDIEIELNWFWYWKHFISVCMCLQLYLSSFHVKVFIWISLNLVHM